jgi:hypothetical protein
MAGLLFTFAQPESFMDSEAYKEHVRQGCLGRVVAALIAVLMIMLAFWIAGPPPSGF